MESSWPSQILNIILQLTLNHTSMIDTVALWHSWSLDQGGLKAAGKRLISGKEKELQIEELGYLATLLHD